MVSMGVPEYCTSRTCSHRRERYDHHLRIISYQNTQEGDLLTTFLKGCLSFCSPKGKILTITEKNLP
jgi:hypothetical protein